jgi:hypothetical protein
MAGAEDSLFSKTMRPALGPTKPPLLNGPRQLSRLKCSISCINNYLHSSMRLHFIQWQPYLYLTYSVTMVIRFLLFVQTVLFIVSPSMRASAHTKHALRRHSVTAAVLWDYIQDAHVHHVKTRIMNVKCVSLYLELLTEMIFASLNTSQVDASRNVRSSSGNVVVTLARF